MDLSSVDSGPAVDAIDYTTFSSEIDLMAVHKRDIQGIAIVAATAGASVVVRMPGQTAESTPASRTLVVAAGDFLPIRARSIVSVTNITAIRAYWGRY